MPRQLLQASSQQPLAADVRLKEVGGFGRVIPCPQVSNVDDFVWLVASYVSVRPSTGFNVVHLLQPIHLPDVAGIIREAFSVRFSPLEQGRQVHPHPRPPPRPEVY